MANTLAPNGFTDARFYAGGAPNYQMREARIAYNNTNKIALNDPVKLLSTGYIDLMAVGGSTIHGIFRGCEYYDPVSQRYLWMPYWPAPSGLPSTAIVKAKVVVDPMATFIAQINGGPAVQAAIGQNIDITTATSGAPNAAGISVCSLDYTTLATTATLPFRIVGIMPTGMGVGSTYDSTAANNWVEVRPNTSDAASSTGI